MHTAMAIRSCSNHSPKFPNNCFSSYSTKLNLCISSYSSSTPLLHTHSCSAVQQDTVLAPSRESQVEWHHNWCDEATTRRKRRRRRRKRRNTLEWTYNDGIADDDEDDDDDDDDAFTEKKVGKSKYMTPKEEAKFSWYLKERARVEAVRAGLLADTAGNELSTSEWAKAARISRHKLDKILWNGRESEKRITSCYHGLVVSIASSYLGKGLCLQDLVQEGSIGLLRGAIKFDPERGYKLSTYAYWWIRQSITRAVANKSRIIRLPGSVIELIPRICEANNALTTKLGRFPIHEEIAEAIDVSAEAVRLAIERNRSPISLDQAMTSQGYMSLQDIIPGPDELTPEAMMKKGLQKPEIGKLLQPLCEREEHILRLHYGLNGESLWSFEEIGKLLKLSRERVRQINSAALLKLREASEIDDLNYFL